MADVRVENVTHRYVADQIAVNNVSLEIPDGTAAGLLGPSGCGKTTLMKVVAGLLVQSEGHVYFNNQEVSALTTQERNVCMVFQFPVVYRSMSVRANLEFPLKNMGYTQADINKKVTEVAETLGITGILDTSGGHLGPGDQQLASLGRAIVRDDPNVILLDEPLTDVEPERRLELRRTLKVVQKDLAYTMIYVTHDQTEALTFSDKIAVMRDGRILQFAEKDELFYNPAEPFVGLFIGSPGMNFFDCSLTEEGLDSGEFTLKISKNVRDVLEENDTKFTVGLRPELAEISTSARTGFTQFKCSFIEFQGNVDVYSLTSGAISLDISSPHGTHSISRGDDVWVGFTADNTKIYSSQGKLLV
jgi:glycerol transport system ATP-binding protein